MRGTWQTTDGGGGGGLGVAVLVLLGAALAVKLAGPVVAAVAELVQVLLITAVVILGLAAVALVAFVAYRVRLGRPKSAARVIASPPGMARAARPLPAPQPTRALPEPQPAIERAPEVHVHHHWHSVSAEDVEAILARRETQADHD
jgi:hypothetical protein